MRQIGLQLMFCNTYHLLLQPKTGLVKQAGGLHRYINRDMPIITDRGDFRFSLAYGSVADEIEEPRRKKNRWACIKINEEGVLFSLISQMGKSLAHTRNLYSAQKELGADIIIPFDELPPYHIEQAAQRIARSHTRWKKALLLLKELIRKIKLCNAVVLWGSRSRIEKRAAIFYRSYI